MGLRIGRIPRLRPMSCLPMAPQVTYAVAYRWSLKSKEIATFRRRASTKGLIISGD